MDKRLAMDFDQHLKSVMADLGTTMQEIQNISEISSISEVQR